jgi:hypothetical protein
MMASRLSRGMSFLASLTRWRQLLSAVSSASWMSLEDDDDTGVQWVHPNPSMRTVNSDKGLW